MAAMLKFIVAAESSQFHKALIEGIFKSNLLFKMISENYQYLKMMYVATKKMLNLGMFGIGKDFRLKTYLHDVVRFLT